MKILVFCPYYPPHIGGLETHADEFNFYLSKKGFDITVFTPRIPTDTRENEIIYEKVRIVRFPAFEVVPNYPLPMFWSVQFWKMFKNLSGGNGNFDLIISRTRFFSTSILALIYSKFIKTPWIHIEHGSGFVILSSKFKTFVAKLYDLTLGKLIFRKSNLNISISKAVQKFIYKFDNRKSPIIYRGLNFVEIDKIPPDNKIKKKYKNKIIIVWAGRLYRWKGVEELTRSIINLPDEIKRKVVFLIIGNGEDYERLKNISKGPSQLLGRKTRSETISILKAADIYIHSSYPGGGLSTSLLEAMYCKCAIIATPNEGADEIISSKNGVLVLNHNEIGTSLISLIKSGNMKKYAQEAKVSVLKKLDWSKSSIKYLEIFKEL